MLRRVGFVGCIALVAGCGVTPGPLSDAGADGGDGRIASCGPGLKALGPACIPIFDECKDDEVPLLGGGCKKVGVEECELDGVPGLRAPPDWTCQRVGVVECEPEGGGTGIKGPPDWTCKRIGVPLPCLPGWAKVDRGWCEPARRIDNLPRLSALHQNGTVSVMRARSSRRTARPTARTIRFPEPLRARIAADAERCGRSYEAQVIAIRRRHYGEDVDIVPAADTILALAVGSLAGVPEAERRRIAARLGEEDVG